MYEVLRASLSRASTILVTMALVTSTWHVPMATRPQAKLATAKSSAPVAPSITGMSNSKTSCLAVPSILFEKKRVNDFHKSINLLKVKC